MHVSSADRRSDCAVSRCGCTIKKTCSELAPYGKWHQDIYYRSESEDASGQYIWYTVESGTDSRCQFGVRSYGMAWGTGLYISDLF